MDPAGTLQALDPLFDAAVSPATTHMRLRDKLAVFGTDLDAGKGLVSDCNFDNTTATTISPTTTATAAISAGWNGYCW